MKKSYFITGTDTNVGKTWVTLALINYFKKQNLSVIGMKPVSAGCEKIEGIWKNDDALAIQKHNSIAVDYSLINPYAYELPISPHLTCKDNPVNLETLFSHFQNLQTLADVVIVEGAGGWYVPLNEQETIADLAKKLNVPIILVAAIKLGCINHTLLTFEAIKNAGLNCAGWIAVCNDADFGYCEPTIDSIKKRISTPLLGILPYLTYDDFETFLAEENWNLHFEND
jgi:dethiobiotin synthetase